MILIEVNFEIYITDLKATTCIWAMGKAFSAPLC